MIDKSKLPPIAHAFPPSLTLSPQFIYFFAPGVAAHRPISTGLNFCSNCLAEAHGGDCVEPANVTMYSVFAQNTLATVAEIQTEIMRNGPVRK